MVQLNSSNVVCIKVHSNPSSETNHLMVRWPLECKIVQNCKNKSFSLHFVAIQHSKLQINANSCNKNQVPVLNHSWAIIWYFIGGEVHFKVGTCKLSLNIRSQTIQFNAAANNSPEIVVSFAQVKSLVWDKGWQIVLNGYFH